MLDWRARGPRGRERPEPPHLHSLPGCRSREQRDPALSGRRGTVGDLGLSARPQPVVQRRRGLLTMAQPERDMTMRRLTSAAAVIGTLLTLGCTNLAGPDLNAPSL